MIILNGQLLRIDAPAAPTAGGDRQWTNGDALAIGVTIDEPTNAQRFNLGASIKDVTVVVYVADADLPAGLIPVEGGRVVAQQDGDDAGTYVVTKLQHRVHDELSHRVLFCEVQR